MNQNKYLNVALALMIIVFFINGYLLYRAMNKPLEVQGTSQTIAETPTGTKIAAEKAGFRIDTGQAKEISTSIKEIRTEQLEPVYIVTTTGKDAVKESEQARKDNKADFAIVTDKNNPDSKVELGTLEKDKKVELNQFNIQAYKPVIRTVSITPDISDKGIRQVNFSIAKKITKDGQYLGVGVGYDIKDKRMLMNISYSW